MTTTNAITDIPDVPSPPDATQFDTAWDEDGERYFSGTDREGVAIRGFQKADGRVRARWINVHHHEVGEMTAADARKLGCALIAAADELERLEGQR